MVAPGDHIAAYVVVRRIGAGGMGEVFLGRHRVLERTVAIKVLLPGVCKSERHVARFLTEARATESIHHPAIVKVLDCDFLADGRAFIVMELLQGLNLRELLARSPGGLPVEMGMAIVGQAAQGLGAAHTRQIVHRDVKPENLFLAAEGLGPPQVKIVDFGIAKLLQPGSWQSLTGTGVLLGTPRYMSPEQCRGDREIDARTDVYALGCVAFELLSGTSVFAADSVGLFIIQQATQAPPRLSERNPSVPGALTTLVDRMLAKAPEDRPQTMVEVESAVAAFLGCSPDEFGRYLDAYEGLRDTWEGESSLPPAGEMPEQAPMTGAALAVRSAFPLTPREPTLDGYGGSPAKPAPTTPLSSSHQAPGPIAAGLATDRRGWSIAGALCGLLMFGGWLAYRSALWIGAEDTPHRRIPPAPAPAAPKQTTVSPATAAAESPFTLALHSEPQGAALWLAGEDTSRGVTPLTLRLPAALRGAPAKLLLEGYEAAPVVLRPSRSTLDSRLTVVLVANNPAEAVTTDGPKIAPTTTATPAEPQPAATPRKKQASEDAVPSEPAKLATPAGRAEPKVDAASLPPASLIEARRVRAEKPKPARTPRPLAKPSTGRQPTVSSPILPSNPYDAVPDNPYGKMPDLVPDKKSP